MIIVITTMIVAFLCGSIPTGYLITKKLCGVDIREHGSGNIGSTNVRRIVGGKLSVITQAGDIIKGLVPMILGVIIAVTMELPIEKNIYLSIMAFVTVMGHDFSPFLGFKGGKGVNTTLGAYFLLIPIPVLAGVVVYFALRFVTKIVSIRSLSLGLTIPFLAIIMGVDGPVAISAIAAAALMIFMHRENIKRLVKKEEK